MPPCSCGRNFAGAGALKDHRKAEGHKPTLDIHGCGSCLARFRKQKFLNQHKISTGHCYCKPCSLLFDTQASLQEHNTNLHNRNCGKCKACFRTPGKLKRHQRLTGHCYCGDCDQSFSDDNSLTKHRRLSGHATEFRCCDCNLQFHSTFGLERHLSRRIHGIPPAKDPGNICPGCKKNFKTSNALRQHRESVAHHPISNVPCIAGCCNKRFPTPSGMIAHLESGACPSGMVRDKLNELVLSNDVDRLISMPDDTVRGTLLGAMRQLGGMTSTEGLWTPSAGSGWIPLTPESGLTSGTQTPRLLTPSSSTECTVPVSTGAMQSKATCPLCPKSQRLFSRPESLRQHIESAAHTPRIFHCPVALSPATRDVLEERKTKPLRYFSTLSGLTQHLESGACEGGKASLFKAVEYVENRLTEIDMRVKLLL